jgi:hypothetical protein
MNAVIRIFCISLPLLSGCIDAPSDGQLPEPIDLELAIATRPLLSSICSFKCNNSHGEGICSDQRDSGEVNFAVFPLIEGTTVVPSTILGTTTGWANTSCPNCQWQFVSLTTTELLRGTAPSVSQATNGPAVVKNVTANRIYEWAGTIVLRIFDPTDASVGTCTPSVEGSLVGPLL